MFIIIDTFIFANIFFEMIKSFNSFTGQGFVVRLIFFLAYSGQSVFLTFYNLYLKDNGFSTRQIGIIASMLNIIMVIILPLWGMIADRLGRKRMLMFVLFTSGLLLWLFRINGGMAWFISVTLLFALFNNPLASFVDNLALDYSEYSGIPLYGQIRVWASIGWAVAVVLAGLFISTYGIKYIIHLGCFILLLTFLVTVTGYKVPERRDTSGVRFLDFRKLISQAGMPFFLIVIFIQGIFSAPLYLFINLYYDEIGADYDMLGIAIAVQSMSELPFFFFGDRIVKRFGPKKVLIVAMLAAVIRMFLYGITGSPVLAIIVGVLHGLCLGLFIIATISYIQALTPSRLRATGQSLMYATYFGAGFTLGNLFIGFISELIMMKGVMLVNSAAILILSMIVLLKLPPVKRLNKYTPTVSQGSF